MGKLEPSDFYFYRWRYYIGYGLIIALLAVFLIFVGQNVPGALSNQEMQSVVHAANLNLGHLDTFTVLNAPYYSLQKLSLYFLGISPLGVKLPSLILAFATAVGAALLLRRWFTPNVAILATLLLTTTMEFLYLAQSGTPDIMYMLWSVWLLLAATQVTNKEATRPNLWRVIFFILAGLSLYTPLSLYLLIAIISAALLHPHVRFVVKQIPLHMYTILLLIMGVCAVPLGYLISQRPMLLLELLGKPAAWPPDIIHNAWQLIHQYFDFLNAATDPLATPVFGPGLFIIMVLGAWQLAKTSYNARSYTLAAWLILLLPVVLINPAYSSITFVPTLLLIASGIFLLLRSWYGLFPRNPYARVVGLLPLVVLVSGLVLSGIDRYVYGYQYDPIIARHFSRDSQLLTKQLALTKDPVSVVATPDEVDFYRVVTARAAKDNHTSVVVSTDPRQYFDQTATVIVSHGARANYSGQAPLDIITTSAANDSDRFYIYKNTSK
jgi:Dolichyl-phosphate-mannose-protein mannosyltransferase